LTKLLETSIEDVRQVASSIQQVANRSLLDTRDVRTLEQENGEEASTIQHKMGFAIHIHRNNETYQNYTKSPEA